MGHTIPGPSGEPPHASSESRSEEHTSELQSRPQLVCRLLLEKKKVLHDLFVPEHRSVMVSDLFAGTPPGAQVHPEYPVLRAPRGFLVSYSFFFFNDTATTEIYTLSLHDALPISSPGSTPPSCGPAATTRTCSARRSEEHTSELQSRPHLVCRLLLEKKKQNKYINKEYSKIKKKK